MSAPDEGKLIDRVCFVVDERTFIDLNRHCVRLDMKVSEFVRGIVRDRLYGCMLADEPKHVDQHK